MNCAYPECSVCGTGMAIFITFSLINFAASALAPLSVRMPIESSHTSYDMPLPTSPS